VAAAVAFDGPRLRDVPRRITLMPSVVTKWMHGRDR